jgi:tRNA (guanine37-N1)-methyltransferase
MRFDIITIFPKIFGSYFAETILARAQKNNLIEIRMHDLRQWTDDNHKTVDDSPYGGGPGMVMMVEPIFRAVTALKNYQLPIPKSQTNPKKQKIRTILFSAKGKPYTQADARRLAEYDQIIMICGRYEGIDERVAEHIADEELSVGNFVLTGGEIPAMIVVDTVSRLIPGVLGKEESLVEESFSDGDYLEYPQYTRPEEFRGWKVPEVLLSGDHEKIREWRKTNAKFKNQNVK